MLAGGLSGAPGSRRGRGRSANAVFFVAMDIAAFAGAEHFLRETTAVSQHVRAAPRSRCRRKSCCRATSNVARKLRRQKAGLVLDDGTWGQLTQITARLNVPVPT